MSKWRLAAATAALTTAMMALGGCEEGLKVLSKDNPGFGSKADLEYLRCEYRVNPRGIDTTEPRLSWIMESDKRSQHQTAYQILVANDPHILAGHEGNMWNSGKIVSGRSNQIVYEGEPLASRMPYWWKVRIWDQDGNISRWSEPASWTMGLLEDDAWRAKWIGFDASRDRSAAEPDIAMDAAEWIWTAEGEPATEAPIGPRFFRRTFELPADRRIARAFCAVAADNQYMLFVNERRTRDGSNFKQAVASNITDQLKPGTNVLAIQATNSGEDPNPAGLLAVCRIEFETGEPMIVATDADWLAGAAGGDDWMNLAFDDGDWRAAKVLGDYGMKPWEQVEVASGELFLPPVQFLRTEFTADKPVARATAYATALGNYELHVNGRRIENAYFTPGWTDYDIRVYYNTFDVTDMVREGDNAIGAMLADGWYSGHIGWKHIRDHYGKEPRLSVQLHIDYQDGTGEIVTTDGGWVASTGPILEGDFLMGETYDARLEMPGWSTAGFDDSGWRPVDVNDAIDAKIESYPSVLVRPFQQIKPVGMTEPKPDVYVFDMGTNFAGFVRLKVRADEGTKVVLRFAERLNPDGTIYTTNLRGARATDTYICKGGGQEIWQPRFTFHGFQYVEVTGYPGKPSMDAVRGIELTSATPVVGSFTCSDVTANTLYRNICQTQRANFIEIPTDCPQRDERLGWTGDAQIYVRTATYNADVAAFFNKWLVDLEDAQLPNGAFPDVAPRKVATGGGTAAWGDAGVICPWTIYQVYGDTRVLEKHYDAMQEWIEYCKGTTKDLLRPAQGYGDWLSIKADTPKDVLATAYFAYSTMLTGKVARVLGKEDDAETYRKFYEDIREAFNKAYVDETGRIKGDTQTVYVLALAFDLLPQEKRSAVVDRLVADIDSRGWHLSTGFVGTKDLMTTLTRVGREDVAYRLFHQDTFPSWGFSIKHGATSIWERWDGWTPDKGFQNPGMNSFAHYSFGAVAEWMFKTIAGIDTLGPAYKTIVIRPRPGGELTSARASYDSIYGEIATYWRLKGDKFNLHATIPANTTAHIHIPTADLDSIKEGWSAATNADGLRFIRMENGAAVFEAGSGKYKFTSRLK